MRRKVVICRNLAAFKDWVRDQSPMERSRYIYYSDAMHLRGLRLEDIVFVEWPTDDRYRREVQQELRMLTAMVYGDPESVERFLNAF